VSALQAGFRYTTISVFQFQQYSYCDNVIVSPTKIEIIRRIACLADNQMNTIVTEEMNIVGVAGSWGSGSKFIVAIIPLTR
jgi:hypothetical protein